MSGDKYLISDQNATYFCTLTVVHWIDVFSRQVYRDIIVESLNFCIKAKGLDINAWVVMTNHVHLVCSARPGFRLSEILRDFKKFTSKAITKEIESGIESRRDWLLDKFSFEARRSGRSENYKIWKDGNHAICLDEFIGVSEKIDYIHDNPVKAGWVNEPGHYIYSSAGDYEGKKGLVVPITFI